MLSYKLVFQFSNLFSVLFSVLTGVISPFRYNDEAESYQISCRSNIVVVSFRALCRRLRQCQGSVINKIVTNLSFPFSVGLYF